MHSHLVLHQHRRANPPHPNMSRFQDILDIASITIDTLTEIGVEDCCFIGSVACRLYEQDEDRDPKVRHTIESFTNLRMLIDHFHLGP